MVGIEVKEIVGIRTLMGLINIVTGKDIVLGEGVCPTSQDASWDANVPYQSTKVQNSDFASDSSFLLNILECSRCLAQAVF